MPENIIQKYYPLGGKTLAMLILKRCLATIILFIVLLIGLFLMQYIPVGYVNIALYVVLAYTVLLLFFLVGAVFLGWLEYYRYEIVLGDNSLKMQRGLISVEQVGIPYRHIQDIKIERTLLDQVMGVSELMVTTSGPEQQEIHPGEGERGSMNRIILPAIEKKIARQIQEIILNKSQVQQMDISERGI